MEIKFTKQYEVEVEVKEVKTLLVMGQVSDGCELLFRDENGDTIKNYYGYTPKWMQGSDGENYIQLEIDIETGKVIGWDEIRERLKSENIEI